LTGLYLHSNQLTGAIPAEIGDLIGLISLHLESNQLTGAIPVGIDNLTGLIRLYLDNNELTDLPELSALTSLSYLTIQNNKFTFEDIEPNINVATNFTYSPQDSVGIKQDIFVDQDSSFTFSITVGGEHNQYQWLKDEVTILGATDSSYTIFSVALLDAGSYTCNITNTIVAELILHSRSTNITVKTTIPIAPQNLTDTAEDQQVTLYWSPNTEPDLQKYNIYRSTSSPAIILIDSVVSPSPPDTFYVNTGLINEQIYFYKITAVDSAGNESDFSNEVSAIPKPFVQGKIISYDLRDIIFQATVYSATGNNWIDIINNYNQSGNGWIAPSEMGCFIKSINSVGGVTKNCIFSNPDYDGTVYSTVAEYTVSNPINISTYYGLGDGALIGNVRFVIQIKEGLNYTTILDSTVKDFEKWRYFNYDLSDWKNDVVLLRLITDPNDDTVYDWSHWAESVITMEHIPKLIYVSPTGSDNIENGSQSSPFKTIQYGINQSQSGDTVIVYPGIYEENINFKSKNIVVSSLHLLDGNRNNIQNTIIDGGNINSVVYIGDNLDTNTVFNGFTIQNGKSSNWAGGITIMTSSPIISNCIIKNNDGYDGGGIGCMGNWEKDHYPIIKNCFIYNNSNYWYGGGIQCWKRFCPKIINCIIAKNKTENNGGGLGFYGNSNADIINCTIVDNESNIAAGGLWSDGSNIKIKNSIVWSNISEINSSTPLVSVSGSFNINYCDIQYINNLNDIAGSNNFDLYPYFNNMDNLDYGINSQSFCIGAGTLTGAPNDDYEGNIRPNPIGSSPDLGAYENSLSERIGDEQFTIITEGAIEGGVTTVSDNILYATASDDKIYRFDNNGATEYTLQVNGNVKSATTVTSNHTVYIASTDKNLYSFNSNGVTNPGWPLSLGSEATASVAVDVDENAYIGTQNGIFQAVSPGGQILWSYNVGASVYASAAITSENILYIVNYEGRLYAFDLNTLDPNNVQYKWRIETGSNVTASPAIDYSDNIYITTLDGKLIKIHNNGNGASIVWEFNTGNSIESSPIIGQDTTVFFGCDNNAVFAINGETGNQIWKINTNGPVKSTGYIAQDATSNILYIGSDDGNLYTIDVSTETILSAFYVGSEIKSPINYYSGIVYFGTMDGRIIAMEANGFLSKSLAENTTTSSIWPTFQGNHLRTGNQATPQTDINVNKIPDKYTLNNNYPNPFNPQTCIQYGLPELSDVKLIIYDVMGRKIKEWNITNQQPGWHEVIWNGTDMNGNVVSTGVYIYSLQAGDFVDTKKMVYMK
jgi:outer membrane protein assembly factor BamB